MPVISATLEAAIVESVVSRSAILLSADDGLLYFSHVLPARRSRGDPGRRFRHAAVAALPPAIAQAVLPAPRQRDATRRDGRAPGSPDRSRLGARRDVRGDRDGRGISRP